MLAYACGEDEDVQAFQCRRQTANSGDDAGNKKVDRFLRPSICAGAKFAHVSTEPRVIIEGAFELIDRHAAIADHPYHQARIKIAGPCDRAGGPVAWT